MKKWSAWYVLPLVVFSATARGEPFTSCSQVATYLSTPTGTPPQRQARLAEAIRYTSAIADQPNEKCLDAMVDRLLHAYARTIDDYSTSTSLRSAEAKRNWSSSAAQEWRKYVHWFLERSRPVQDTIVVAWAGRSEEADSPDVRRARWLPKRIGGALESMIAASRRAGEQAVMLEALEQETANNVDVPSPVVLAEWHRWLRVQPNFPPLEPSDDDVAKTIRSNSVARLRWTGFADFLERCLPARTELTVKWEPVRQTVKGWLTS